PRLRHGTFALIAIALIGAASLLAKTPLLFAFSTPRPPILFDPPMLPKPAPQQLLAQTTPPPPSDDAIATFNRLILDAPNARTKGDLYLKLGEAYRSKGD